MIVKFLARSSLRTLFSLSIFVCLVDGFFVPSTSSVYPRRNEPVTPTTYDELPRKANSLVLSAKKKRRRRRKDGVNKPQEQKSLEPGARLQGDKDELPEFDVDGEQQGETKTSTQTMISFNPDEITDAMMGDGNKRVRSVKELISDRSLESRFEFDEPADDPSLPDFTQLAREFPSSSSSLGSAIPEVGMGKKKQRQAERRANAIRAKDEEEQGENPLSNIPFFLNEEGEISAIKILESGGKQINCNSIISLTPFLS